MVVKQGNLVWQKPLLTWFLSCPPVPLLSALNLTPFLLNPFCLTLFPFSLGCCYHSFFYFNRFYPLSAVSFSCSSCFRGLKPAFRQRAKRQSVFLLCGNTHTHALTEPHTPPDMTLSWLIFSCPNGIAMHFKVAVFHFFRKSHYIMASMWE